MKRHGLELTENPKHASCHLKQVKQGPLRDRALQHIMSLYDAVPLSISALRYSPRLSEDSFIFIVLGCNALLLQRAGYMVLILHIY